MRYAASTPAAGLEFLNAQLDRYNLEQAAKRHAEITTQAVTLLALAPEEPQKIKIAVPVTPVSRVHAAIT